MRVQARGVLSKESPFHAIEIERRALQPEDVLIEIQYCGICHSDIHSARGEWGEVRYPFVPGHEITGIVKEVGPAVTRFKPGDRVGVGCMVDSCGECENCKRGDEQYCVKGNIQTYGSVDRYGQYTMGGYSTHIVVKEDFVLRIPDALPLDKAAPLLCAGITTYSPLRHWQAGPGKEVAVIGLGGLGHMAVKLAKAMGAEVTVLSQSLRKKEDGLRLGAKAYYATSDPETFRQLAGRFDLIINTVSAKIPINAYLELLKTDGTLVNVGAPPEALEVNAFPLITHRRSFAGSCIGGIRETQEMLDFCAAHGVTPEIEMISADEIDAAWERVLKSDVRYRFVIDISTMRQS
ncbi:NAD(P)-dependent alcohol dehydrogenase [Alicyclobacillus sendaiensis]|uniref:NAD(P)-dependent alcohol dehydrogenase n=1 Tax=Alicyclobacillus sendaiensis TaxID=192387 RepID=UPI00078077C0|nr:NAD(P)-dependent alcohol dehydrogenase [Alicyclobacillus sendaiensis]